MRILITLFAFCTFSILNAQNVGIGTTSPDPSATLDIVDSDGGLLIPRTDTSNISSPATGLLIYQNSDNAFYYHNGSEWSLIGSSASTIDQINDSDADTRIQVEEFPDEDRIRFYIKGDEVLQMHGKRIEFLNNGESLFLGQFAGASDDLSDNRNTFIGYRAGKSNTTGANNVALGNQALDKTSDGNNNIAIGKQSMFQNTGSNNIGIGLNASQKNTTGTKNIAIGNNANFNNINGDENLVIGDEAGKGIATNNISNNILIGNRAGISLQGSNNLAIGRDALSIGSNLGTGNVAIGDSSMHNIAATNDNVAIGFKAGKELEAYQNTIVGAYAGEFSEGDRNSFFGYKSGYKSTGLNNSFFGHSSGLENTSGRFNCYFGAFSGQSNQIENFNSFFGYDTGSDNVACCNSFFGSKAGSDNTMGHGNTFLGSEAGEGNLAGSDNVIIGSGAGKLSNSNQSTIIGSLAGYKDEGTNNSMIGYQSGFANTAGTNNSYLGYYSGLSNIAGSDNTCLGHMAGLDNDANDNIFVGSEAGRWNHKGSKSIAIGNRTAYRDLTMNNSVYLGYEAGYLNATSSRTGNVFIGYQAGYNEDKNNRLIIENSNSNFPLIYGKFDENSLSVNGNIGLGTYTPVTKLTIRGGNDPLTGAVASFEPSVSDQEQCGRLRFLESSGEDNWRGSFIRLDGLNNKFHIGVHNANNGFVADDINILTISRNSGFVGIGEENPIGELHISDRDATGGVLQRMSTTTSEVIIGYNPSIQGFIGTESNNDMRIITNNIPRMIIENSGFVGIGTSNPSQRLHVIGNICATGSIASCSDQRFKKNFTSITSPLTKLNEINGYYYNWKVEEFPERDFNSERQIGLIAQEVEAIFPEMVLTGSDGYKSIDYAKLTPVLLEAIKMLNDKIEDQEKVAHQQNTLLEALSTRVQMIESNMIKGEN